MEATQVMKLNSVGYLRLAYVATEITLHRRIILVLCPSTNPHLFQICRSVPMNVSCSPWIVQSFKPQHLSSFWYFASPQNFALIAVFSTLLLSTVTSSEEAGFYKTKLREYRRILKINSENRARYMKPAMALLDANMAFLVEAKKMSRPEPTETNSTESPGIENGFNSANTPLTNHFAVSNAHLRSSSDLDSPGHFTFDPPSYNDRQSESTSRPTCSAGNTEARSEIFDYGLRSDTNLWY
jgi:hypothetical protein